jgi:hypothetical protein
MPSWFAPLHWVKFGVRGTQANEKGTSCCYGQVRVRVMAAFFSNSLQKKNQKGPSRWASGGNFNTSQDFFLNSPVVAGFE